MLPAVFAEVIDITPDLAQHWLDTLEHTERPATLAWGHIHDEADADRYAEDMRTGRWRHFAGEPIRFDDGVLRDGWARLTAITRTGVTCSLLVTGRTPLPPQQAGHVLRDKRGRIICQFCITNTGHRIQRREVRITKNGNDNYYDFVVCSPCLESFGVPNDSSEWHQRNLYKSGADYWRAKLKTAEETAAEEAGQPRYSENGEPDTCNNCGGAVRIFVTTGQRPYMVDAHKLYPAEVEEDHRWVYVPQVRRIQSLRRIRKDATVWFPHFVVCGTTKTVPRHLAQRGLWQLNGGQRPTDLTYSDKLIDMPGILDGFTLPPKDDGTTTPLF